MAFIHSPKIVTDGLVLALDAGNVKSYISGSTIINDLTGNNSTGSLQGGVGYSGSNGGTLVFDGVNDFVIGSTSTNYAFGTQNFTANFWVYANTYGGGGGAPIIDLRTNTAGTGPGFSAYLSNSKKYALYWGSADKYVSTTNIETGSWYNIVSTRSGSTLSVYINSVLDGTGSDSTNLTENLFRLARNVNTSGTSYLNGRISYVLLYKGKALSSSEIAQNFNATRGRFGL